MRRAPHGVVHATECFGRRPQGVVPATISIFLLPGTRSSLHARGQRQRGIAPARGMENSDVRRLFGLFEGDSEKDGAEVSSFDLRKAWQQMMLRFHPDKTAVGFLKDHLRLPPTQARAFADYVVVQNLEQGFLENRKDPDERSESLAQILMGQEELNNLDGAGRTAITALITETYNKWLGHDSLAPPGDIESPSRETGDNIQEATTTTKTAEKESLEESLVPAADEQQEQLVSLSAAADDVRQTGNWVEQSGESVDARWIVGDMIALTRSLRRQRVGLFTGELTLRLDDSEFEGAWYQAMLERPELQDTVFWQGRQLAQLPWYIFEVVRIEDGHRLASDDHLLLQQILEKGQLGYYLDLETELVLLLTLWQNALDEAEKTDGDKFRDTRVIVDRIVTSVSCLRDDVRWKLTQEGDVKALDPQVSNNYVEKAVAAYVDVQGSA